MEINMAGMVVLLPNNGVDTSSIIQSMKYKKSTDETRYNINTVLANDPQISVNEKLGILIRPNYMIIFDDRFDYSMNWKSDLGDGEKEKYFAELSKSANIFCFYLSWF